LRRYGEWGPIDLIALHAFAADLKDSAN
jgi:hypothetical protein